MRGQQQHASPFRQRVQHHRVVLEAQPLVELLGRDAGTVQRFGKQPAEARVEVAGDTTALSRITLRQAACEAIVDESATPADHAQQPCDEAEYRVEQRQRQA
jgi:hypothetical protein